MKAATRIVRILQILGLLLLVIYLALIGRANPNTTFLPLLLPLPTEWVIAIALLLGFIVGWLSLSRRVFRLNRQNKALHQQLIKAGLETEPAPPEPARKGLESPRR